MRATFTSLFCALGVLAATAAGCASSRSPGSEAPTVAPPVGPTGFATYHRADKGFSITFPANWELKRNHRTAAVAAVSPADNPGDQVRESVAVVVEDLPAGTALEAYDAAVRDKLRAHLKSDGYEEQEHVRGKLGEAEAVRLVCSHRKGGRPLKLITWLVVKGGRGYTVSCIADPKDFDRYLPQFEQIAGSFTAY